jgi:hypothetical protein
MSLLPLQYEATLGGTSIHKLLFELNGYGLTEEINKVDEPSTWL